jgi:hypothetical protein
MTFVQYVEVSDMRSGMPTIFLSNPVFRVIAAWVWWAAGAGLTLWILTAALGFRFTEFHNIYSQFPHLLIYVEIMGVGLFPLALTLVYRENLEMYGIHKRHVLASFAWSLLIIAANSIFLFLSTGRWYSWRTLAIHLDFPGNLWYARLGVFAYGSLELFFVVWLIVNTEKVFRGWLLNISWGLIVAVILIGLAHVATASNLQSAVHASLVFFLLGLMFRRTGNSIGPMVAWTLINGQVLYLAQFLLS